MRLRALFMPLLASGMQKAKLLNQGQLFAS